MSCLLAADCVLLCATRPAPVHDAAGETGGRETSHTAQFANLTLPPLLYARDALAQTLYESSLAFGMRKALLSEAGKSDMETRCEALAASEQDLQRQVMEGEKQGTCCRGHEGRKAHADADPAARPGLAAGLLVRLLAAHALQRPAAALHQRRPAYEHDCSPRWSMLSPPPCGMHARRWRSGNCAVRRWSARRRRGARRKPRSTRRRWEQFGGRRSAWLVACLCKHTPFSTLAAIFL